MQEIDLKKNQEPIMGLLSLITDYETEEYYFARTQLPVLEQC